LLTFATDSVAEAAVVGINDELTGQAVNAFVALKDGNDESDQTKKDLIIQVRKSIGPFAAPKAVFIVPDLPKTRSGKIMRRILRKILAGEEDQLGDITTVRTALTRLYAGQGANGFGSYLTRQWWRRSSRSCIRPRSSERKCGCRSACGCGISPYCLVRREEEQRIMPLVGVFLEFPWNFISVTWYFR
jgi:hypothetical protein